MEEFRDPCTGSEFGDLSDDSGCDPTDSDSDFCRSDSDSSFSESEIAVFGGNFRPAFCSTFSNENFVIVHSSGCPACRTTMGLLSKLKMPRKPEAVEVGALGGELRKNVSRVKYIPAFFTHDARTGRVAQVKELEGAPSSKEAKAKFAALVEAANKVYTVEL
jgi:thiol-disulfide isomerase/thioredoxin